MTARHHVAEQSDLAASSPGWNDRHGKQDVGLDTDFAQFLDRVLGRLGLQLAGGGCRAAGQVHVAGVVAPSSMPIWRMASRNGSDSMSPTVPPTSTMATSALRRPPDLALDLVGDVRMTWTVCRGTRRAAPSFDHRLVDLAGGEVVALAIILALVKRSWPRSRSVSAPSSVTNTSPCWNHHGAGSTLM